MTSNSDSRLAARVVAVVMGFALGYAVIRSGSLWTGVIFHAAFNAGVLMLSWFAGRNIEMNIYALTASPQALSLFIADTVATGALFGLMLLWLIIC